MLGGEDDDSAAFRQGCDAVDPEGDSTVRRPVDGRRRDLDRCAQRRRARVADEERIQRSMTIGGEQGLPAEEDGRGVFSLERLDGVGLDRVGELAQHAKRGLERGLLRGPV